MRIPTHRPKYGIPNRKKFTRRWLVVQRDGAWCSVCGETKWQHLTIDHMISRSRGGTNQLDNLQLLCRACHCYKDCGGQNPIPNKFKNHMAKRTNQQSRALHKAFKELADLMLEQGIERKTVVEDLDTYTCPIDEAFMKEVWRAIMFTQTGKLSTTQLETVEVNRVYETFNRFLADQYAISIPFPSMEALSLAFYDSEVW